MIYYILILVIAYILWHTVIPFLNPRNWVIKDEHLDDEFKNWYYGLDD